MPNGYLVSLGDNTLDVNDTINATPVFFTILSTIGTGDWRWSGVWSGNGQSYSNINDSGVYYEATDGNVYFIPDTWTTNSGSAVVTSAPAYTAPNFVNGTSGDDVMGAGFTDVDGDEIDGGDGTGPSGHEETISAGDGNDSVDAGLEDDFVYGGGGNDTLEGGSGNDTLFGDTDEIAPGGVAGNDSLLGGAGDDVIYGEDGADTLRGDAGSDTLFGGDGADDIGGGDSGDVIDGGDGNDTILGDAGADTITGGIGDDSIDGGAGDDLVGEAEVADSTTLDWSNAGANGTYEFTGANNATLEVTISTTTNVSGQTASVQTQGTPAAEGLWVSQITEPITTTMTFDAPVENLNFEIFDLDENAGSWDDRMTVIGLDADGNQVPVVFSDLDGLHTATGNVIDADGSASGGIETFGADDSVTVDIAGPIVQLILIFDHGEDSFDSGLYGIGDMSMDFTADVDTEPGDDTIAGGSGNDTIYADSGDDSVSGGTGSDSIFAGSGDDTINVGEGDTVVGGDGDDTFQLVELGETVGAGAGIFVQGDEGDETTGDVLNLGTLGDRNDIIYSNTDDAAGGLSGTLVLEDGTLLTFENIEKIICFTPETLIDTPFGPRAVETLKAGDLVMTRDAGAQPLKWVGARTIPCTPDTAPIVFEHGALEGQTAALKVSPQHKILVSHFAAELLFGQDEVFCSAKHMLSDQIKRVAQKMVTYVHIMFETHQVITANGVKTESFHAGPEGMNALSEESKVDLFEAFPALKSDPYAHGKTAYPCLKAHETALLMQEIALAEEWRMTQQRVA